MPVKKVIDKTTNVLKIQVIKYFAHILYFAGLTALIPLLPLLLAPDELVNAKNLFISAIALVIFAFVLVYTVSHSKRAAFRTLGMTTIIPGLLAVLFAYVGETRTLIAFTKLSEISPHVTPFVQAWVDQYVPKAWVLAGIYIIVGVLMIFISEQSKK